MMGATDDRGARRDGRTHVRADAVIAVPRCRGPAFRTTPDRRRAHRASRAAAADQLAGRGATAGLARRRRGRSGTVHGLGGLARRRTAVRRAALRRGPARAAAGGRWWFGWRHGGGGWARWPPP